MKLVKGFCLHGLYGITPNNLSNEILIERIELALLHGLKILQYRNKGKDVRNQVKQASAIKILVITEDAIKQAEVQLRQNPDLLALVIANTNYNEGVLGIVAGRLKEIYSRPTFVMAVSEDNIAKGSGRSIPSIPLGNLVLAARQSGLLISGGGHDMAAGVSLEVDQLDTFREYLTKKIF